MFLLYCLWNCAVIPCGRRAHGVRAGAALFFVGSWTGPLALDQHDHDHDHYDDDHDQDDDDDVVTT